MLFRSASAVNAALAAYFNANKSDLQQAIAQKQLSDASQEQAQLIANSVNAANDSQAKAAA